MEPDYDSRQQLREYEEADEMPARWDDGQYDPMQWNAAQCYQWMRNNHFEEIPRLLEMATQPHILDQTRQRIRGYLYLANRERERKARLKGEYTS